MKYVLEDSVFGTKTLFPTLKDLYDYIRSVLVKWETFGKIETFRLYENKSGGWIVQYKIGVEWFNIKIWKVTKLQETENGS